MIGPDKRKAVFLLYENGLPLREIGEKLQISRNTVKAIVEQEGKLPERVRQDKKRIDPDYLRELYHKCNGWKRRVYEILTEEEKIEIKYPTLTRLMRELGIGNVQKARCDKVPERVELKCSTIPLSIRYCWTVREVRSLQAVCTCGIPKEGM